MGSKKQNKYMYIEIGNTINKYTLNCNKKLISIDKPIIMGILNATPDSFYKASRVTQSGEVLKRAQQIIAQGGEIIDIGAYSSRLGADNITAEQEWARLEPVLATVRDNFNDVLISLDTFRADIAYKAYQKYNIDIINDISAGEIDPEMFNVAAQIKVPYILMHMQGTPKNMQQNTVYNNMVQDIFMFFAKKIEQLTTLGVNDIIIDPGFGFSKTVDQNYELLKRLTEFSIFELPVLAGFSRKSMIYKVLNTNADNALNGTTVLNTMALERGAKILRVHDVKEAFETIELFEKLHSVN